MYKIFLFKKIGLGVLIIFISAVILVATIFLNIKSLEKFSAARQMATAFFCVGMYLLVWWYVFWRLFISLKIEPNQNSERKSLQEIKTSFVNYFSEAKSDKGQYFEITEIKNGLQISWNKAIDFDQIFTSGSNNIKYKVSFIFNENKYECGIHTSVIYISKNISLQSIRWVAGIIYETGEDYMPSFNSNGDKISMDMKKLSYNNATIIDPMIEILKTNGWSSSFIVFRHKISRIIYTIIGWALLVFAITSILFGSLVFIPETIDTNSNIPKVLGE